jgi:hypothetical protein
MNVLFLISNRYDVFCEFINIECTKWNTYSYIVEVSIIGGGNRSTRRNPHAASHWQTLSRDVVSSTFRMRDNVNEGTEKTTISQDLFNRFDMFWMSVTCGMWLSPGTPVSSTNKTDLHDITEILLKVALNTIKPTNHTKCMRSNKCFWIK